MNNSRILLGGVIIGALTGLIAAMLINRRAQQNENSTAVITAGEGVKLGVLIFGLLRAIASIGDD